MKPRRSVWNTYRTLEYVYDVAGDEPRQEYLQLHQVRRLKTGWQTRVLEMETDGSAQTPGPIEAITDAEGEAHYATAVQKWEASVEAAVRLQKAVERLPLDEGRTV